MPRRIGTILIVVASTGILLSWLVALRDTARLEPDQYPRATVGLGLAAAYLALPFRRPFKRLRPAARALPDSEAIFWACWALLSLWLGATTAEALYQLLCLA